MKAAYDVVVVGGGMVGGVLALTLARAAATKHLRIALLEPNVPAENALSATATAVPDIRATSLSPGSVDLLKCIGAWDRIGPLARPFNDMRLWDATSSRQLHISSDSSSGPLGDLAENKVVTAATFDLLRKNHSDTVDIIGGKGSNLSALALPPDGKDPVATLANGQTLSAKLLVGADGHSSAVRRFAQLPTVGWDYGRKAVVATVAVSYDHTTAFQVFRPNGPLALLPHRSPFSSLVWSTTTADADRLVSLSDAEFIDEVNAALALPPPPPSPFAAFHSRDQSFPESASTSLSTETRKEFSPLDTFASTMDSLLSSKILQKAAASAGLLPSLLAAIANSTSTSPMAPPTITACVAARAAFPLRLQQSTSYFDGRVVLVGDAAHTVHPLSGQGANLGLADAAALAAVLGDAVGDGADIGAAAVLREYQQRRQLLNTVAMAAADLINRAFAVDAIAPIRRGVIHAIDAIPLVKWLMVTGASASETTGLVKAGKFSP